MSLLQDVFPNYGKIKDNNDINSEEDTLKEYRKQLKEIIKTSSLEKEEEKIEPQPNKEKFYNSVDTEILYQLISESIALRKDLLKSQSNLESLVYILMLLIIILTVSVIKLLVIKN
jgi:hypothetical protein